MYFNFSYITSFENCKVGLVVFQIFKEVIIRIFKTLD